MSAEQTALTCRLCGGDVRQLPSDGSYICGGCGLPLKESHTVGVDAGAIGENGDKPDEANAQTRTPRDIVACKELSLLWAKELEPLEESETESLWGPFIFPGSNVLVSGDSGVGKTTLLYNWAVHAARGEEFVGIPFPRPLRVLYVDLETPDNLRRTKLNVISTSDRPEGLAFMPAIDFMEDVHKLALIVKQHSFDVVIIDTISAAFRTGREDDNAEANAQARSIRDLITLTGATVIQVQQIGKGQIAKKVYKARGASARPASADIVLNLETVDADTVKLEMAKNRWLGGNEKLFLLKAGEDQFEVAEVAGDKGVGEVIRAQDWLREWGASREEGAQYKDIQKACPFSEGTLRRAVNGLVQTGQLQKLRRGYYTFILARNHISKVALNARNANPEQMGMDIGTPEANVDGLVTL